MMSDLGAEAFGRPEPFQIRVWSTLNSPGVFGNILVAGLLLLFSVTLAHQAAGYGCRLLRFPPHPRPHVMARLARGARWFSPEARKAARSRGFCFLVLLPVWWLR